MKNTSHRYEKNRPWPRHGHKYAKHRYQINRPWPRHGHIY